MGAIGNSEGDTVGSRRVRVGRVGALTAALVLFVFLAVASAAIGPLDFIQAASSPEAAGDAPVSLTTINIDGDADQDLAVANGTSDNVTILRNNGSGNFSQPATSPVAAGESPNSIAAADLDGDADRDLAVSNQGSDNVTILRNNGSGNFSEPSSSPEPAGSAPFSIAAINVDGDADEDLAVANFSPNNVTILRNTGSANFNQPPSSPEAAGTFPGSVVAADLDGDADLDLAVANQGSADLTILRNSGLGNFSQPASSPEPAGASPAAVGAADIDGDGDSDLAAANNTADTVTILRNNGSANFTQPPTSPEAAGDVPVPVAFADLDGDSDQDLAVANVLTDDVTILRNR